MNKVVCVFSSSSCMIDKAYFEAAYSLGREIANREDVMLYGGGLVGLMGETARGVHDGQGKVIGIIPKALNVKGIVYERCDELIVTEGMRERKAAMDARSDAFIALPGGYGTLEELLEIITLKQLRYHDKPIVILNIGGFFNRLISMFEQIISEKFAKDCCRELYHVANEVSDALSYIDTYKPSNIEEKWMT